MADQEQLDILKQGVEIWNQWRREHPSMVPDLSFADLTEVDLNDADLSGADFSDANLREAQLGGANLRGANFSRTNLIKADMWRANLSEAVLYRAKVTEADLSQANLSDTNLSEAELDGVDFTEANLARADLLMPTPKSLLTQERKDNQMKAIVYTKYGSQDVLELKEVEKPTPKDHEVLVKVFAASAAAGDWHLLRGKPFLMRFTSGLLKPKHTILGAAFAGRVEAMGLNVTLFEVGDEVFGDLSACGFGAFAEYVSVPEHALALKPTRLTFEEAATVPVSAVTALQGLRDKGHIQPGQKVLINGASGGVGTFAVQIAKAFGTEVTAVCGTRNVDMVRSIGADQVIDYTQADFTQNGQRYDLILAVNGYHPIWAYKRALSPKGRYVMTGGSNAQLFQAMLLGPLISTTGKNKMGNLLARPNQKDLVFMKELLEGGKVVPVIERRYPLREVPEAIRYVEEGRARGKVVITVEQNNNTSL